MEGDHSKYYRTDSESRPDAHDVRISHGPVLVGAAGTSMIAAGRQTITFAQEAP